MKQNYKNHISDQSHLLIPEETTLINTLLRFFNYKTLEELYKELHDKGPLPLIDVILDKLGIIIDIPEGDFDNLPLSGPFITISNNPYRGIDSMILIKLLSKKRDDVRMMANFLLRELEPLSRIVIPVNTSETNDSPKSSFPGIKEGMNHLKDGHCISIFPAGTASYQFRISEILLDRPWKTSAMKFIKNASVPVIPVYFHGTNSRLHSVLSVFNPMSKHTKLPSELFEKDKRIIKVRIGSQISLKEQARFPDISLYGQYLRARTYTLGSAMKKKSENYFFIKGKTHEAEMLAEPVPAEVLRDEFEKVYQDFGLFTTKNYSVVCAPVDRIPSIFAEIGRLRELTFRKVGEGTNRSTDIDNYDFYYNHLFVWDRDENRIVGAYRIGKGDDIVALYGKKGFYLHSLFRLKKDFIPVLTQSIELGRSFITPEYQRKPLPLFLLWKGILVFLIRHSEYRYLIGPVSITNDFSKFSKSLIVEFVKKYFFDSELSKLIEPRKEFIVKTDKAIDRKIFIDSSGNDINRIEKIIMDIEPGYRIPVLLKKYLEINGKIIGFNIDPEFNYCLDGFLILDIHKVPSEFIKGLAKEFNDPSFEKRFGI